MPASYPLRAEDSPAAALPRPRGRTMSRTTLVIALGTALLLPALSSAADELAQKLNVKPAVVEKIKAALPDKAPARPTHAHKVLIFSKTNGFRHSSIPVGTVALTLLGEKTGA